MDRETLIAILAALTGGAIAGAAAGATASMVITRKMLADKENGRYAKVIKLQQKLFATNQRLRAKIYDAGISDPQLAYHLRKTAREQITLQADMVLRYVMDNFSGPQDNEAHYMVDDMFNGRVKLETMTIDGLKKILDEVIPVAIAKHMLSYEKVMLDTCLSKEFDGFAHRYRDIILCTKRRPNEDIIRLYPEWAERHGVGRAWRAA